MAPRLILVSALLAASALSLRAQDVFLTPPPSSGPLVQSLSTAESPTYSAVTCTSTDPLACNDALELAVEARDSLGTLLRLGGSWRFPVHIRLLTADDPLALKVDHEAAAVFSAGSTMKIEAVVPVNDPGVREFVQRQFVTALLWERFFANTKTFGHTTRLDVVPVWLIEGLRERLAEDPGHSREAIVRHALATGKAPTLAEVTAWKEISPERLQGLWQRAFCYYLVASLTAPGPRNDDFQQWLDSFSSGATEGVLHFPTEAAWQHELAGAAARGRDLVYTWEETAGELDDDDTITYAEDKKAPVQTCTLDTVVDAKRSPALLEAVKDHLYLLTALELRAHPGWHDVLEHYRAALTGLIQDPNVTVPRQLFAQARHEREMEARYHARLLDYLNWYEVTKDDKQGVSRFEPYFATARAMERTEGDPQHPNPIRANLLQVENQL
jgi:hypothetical protein